MTFNLKRIVREWWGVALFLGLMLLFRSAVADQMLVPSGSMNPTVLEGDHVLVDKHAYGWRVPFTLQRVIAGGDPQRGDVVVFESPEPAHTTLLKRVAAVPGDRVEIRHDQLIINGVAMNYQPLASDPTPSLSSAMQAEQPVFAQENLTGKQHVVMMLPRRFQRDLEPVVVPADHYLMIGDNRDNSQDSRYFGLVERSAIFGKATRVLFSLNPENAYMPRRERILSPTF